MPKTFECIKESTWNGELASPGTKVTAHTEGAEMAIDGHPCWKCLGGETLIKEKPPEVAPKPTQGKEPVKDAPPADNTKQEETKPDDKKGSK